jgi:hypothetical protein
MDSIRKLVSENEKYRLNYFLASKFLKDMGWWIYWKKYLVSPEFKRFSLRYQDECWVGIRNPYDVFGACNFSKYLTETKNKKGIYTVSSMFARFIQITAPKYFETSLAYNFVYGSISGDYTINMQKPGIVEKWKKMNLDDKIKKILNNRL